MKKFLCISAAALVMGAGSATAAIGEWTSGAATVTFTDDSALVISGTGAMENYANQSAVPWYSATGNNLKIKTLVIEEGVTSIGDYAIFNAKGITSLTIPSSVTRIGNHAFHYCHGLTDVTIPEGVTSIGESAFLDCKNMTTLSLPSSLTSIGSEAVKYCVALESVTIPEGVTRIELAAFSQCHALNSVTLPNSLTFIGDYAFDASPELTSIVIPDGVDSIGEAAFDQSPLTSLTLSASLTTIGGWAFSSAISSIVIPANVTSIGASAFSSEELTSVICLAAAPPTLEVEDEEEGHGNFVADADILYVLESSVDAYNANAEWSEAFREMSTVSKYIIALQAQLRGNALQEKIDELEADNATKQGQITALKAREDALKADSARLQGRITTLQDELDDCTAGNGNGSSSVLAKAVEELSVFPNPTASLLTITNEQWKAGDRVEVYTINGTLAASYDVAGEITTVNIAHLPTGTYIVRVGNRSAKVVKQ